MQNEHLYLKLIETQEKLIREQEEHIKGLKSVIEHSQHGGINLSKLTGEDE